MTSEHRRLAENHAGQKHWKRWGPYLSERQWGTVREDYSPGGTAWEYFPHDHARSRAYRWGEDGLAGFSDNQARLCLSLALWNGKDPILKERLFGLSNHEGNHGEDVKEVYYYLDATPTHSYQKMLYKYPQREFPYAFLREENARRKGDPTQPEFELLDTGIFDDDRYWDVFVEYAKADTDDILMRVTVHNRGPEESTLHLLPQLWFRNTWSWDNSAIPALRAEADGTISGQHNALGQFRLVCESKPELLFSDNNTDFCRLFGLPDVQGFFKDAFHKYVIDGNQGAINPQRTGTKAAAHYVLTVPGGGSTKVDLRLTTMPQVSTSSAPSNNVSAPRVAKGSQPASSSGLADCDNVLSQRIREADEFYADIQKDITDEDARRVQRQAFAGMIWSKQFFHYDVTQWLNGDPAQPPPPSDRKHGRNADWRHLNNAEVISMPDKWEYPWYAAWDLGFHCVAFASIDAEFAKRQLVLLTREWYMHPNGQLPAYEWAFDDVNPPVHGWAAWRVFQIDRKQRRESNPEDKGDLAFLERVFHKLMLNFTWWVNRKDAQGRNIFQGGFLGLDNIGVFDRSAPLPTGGFINQADGTSWMAMYCLNLMRIALELARNDKVYEDIATKFFEHFLRIAAAINNEDDGGMGLWDEQDEFYYDQLRTPGGREIPLKVRSMVGLIPLFAVEALDPDLMKELPEFAGRLKWVLDHRPDLAKLVSRWEVCGMGERRLLSLLRGHRMKCLLRRMLDETEFLSDYGVRSLSKAHERDPFRLQIGGRGYEVAYWPAESENHIFGGNSNWRGPIWMPVNFLIIESLQKFHHYYGDDFKIEYPTRSGNFVTIKQVAAELSHRICKLFLKGSDGQRPVLKYHAKLASDPHFKDYVLFHEFFHGDTGRGGGSPHQTGWTGLVAKLLQPRRKPQQPGDAVPTSQSSKAAPEKVAGQLTAT
jgi:hypothetical protein